MKAATSSSREGPGNDRERINVATIEVRWDGLSHEQVLDSLRLLLEGVTPRLDR